MDTATDPAAGRVVPKEGLSGRGNGESSIWREGGKGSGAAASQGEGFVVNTTGRAGVIDVAGEDGGATCGAGWGFRAKKGCPAVAVKGRAVRVLRHMTLGHASTLGILKGSLGFIAMSQREAAALVLHGLEHRAAALPHKQG